MTATLLFTGVILSSPIKAQHKTKILMYDVDFPEYVRTALSLMD